MRYRQAGGVLHQVVGGRAMLIPPAGKEVVVLNATGTVVWGALAEGGDRAALVAAVLAAYPQAAADTVSDDVTAFLTELESADLVQKA